MTKVSGPAIALLSVVGVLVLFGSSCSASHGPHARLVVAGGPLNEMSAGILLHPGQAFLVGSLPICPKGGAVVMTRVDPLGGDGKLTGFSVRRNHGGVMIGDARGTLEDSGLKDSTNTRLSTTCGPADAFYELIVAARAGTTDTYTEGYRVRYADADGRTGTLEIRFPEYACVSLTTAYCAEHFQARVPPMDGGS